MSEGDRMKRMERVKRDYGIMEKSCLFYIIFWFQLYERDANNRREREHRNRNT